MYSSSEAESPSSDGDGRLTASKFLGICWRKRRKEYEAELKDDDSTRYYLGCFKLATDAALVYDKALVLVEGPDTKKKLNFATEQDYLESRAAELKKTGFEINFEAVQAKISAKMNDVRAKLRAKEEEEG